MGNRDLDFQNLNSDFPIEREIRKRISPPRNPSSGWISIKKSKSGFFGFPFLSFDWEIRKRICYTVLVNSSLLFANYACACKTAVLKSSFSNPFSDFPIERQKGKSEKIRIWISQLKSTPRTDFSEVKSVFGFRVRLGNPDLKSRFPNRTRTYRFFNL